MDSLPLSDPTRRLGAPRSWNHATSGICHTLEIVDREGWMISAWRPTPAELKRINEGKVIYLYVGGSSHPPVALGVEK